eukprot:COSAG02_NODE_25136_length_668_cov_0.857645_1_plen_61_part_00
MMISKTFRFFFGCASTALAAWSAGATSSVPALSTVAAQLEKTAPHSAITGTAATIALGMD